MSEWISILGDSISTFAGYSNNVIDLSYPGNYYPQNNIPNDVEMLVRLGGQKQ